MVEENKDHYYSLAREMDTTTLTNKSWWNTTHLGSQTLSDQTEEQYLEFQDGYETLTEQKALILQTYQQGSQSSVESENNNNEKLKQNSKMDDWDKESREYYQEYRANYRDP